MWRDDALLLDILLAAGDAREFVEGLDVVWEVVQNDLPSLIETLKPLIPPEDDFS